MGSFLGEYESVGKSLDQSPERQGIVHLLSDHSKWQSLRALYCDDYRMHPTFKVL